jgi:hypothetical protein
MCVTDDAAMAVQLRGHRHLYLACAITPPGTALPSFDAIDRHKKLLCVRHGVHHV